jgi:hypothetical protein
MTNSKHSSKSSEWYTPLWLVHKIQQVIGPIGLDPCSSATANKRIRANAYWTEQDNSLGFIWENQINSPISIYLNPPSKGKLPGNRSWAGAYWAKLMEFRDSGYLLEAIYLGFSIEQLQVTQKYHPAQMMDFPFCVPSKRIAFDYGEPGKLCPKSPTHANVIVYVPGIWDNSELFYDTFKSIGNTLWLV